MLAFLVPLAAHLGGLPTSAQVLLGVLAVPFLTLTVMCLMSAFRPGSLGRFVRKIRSRGSR
jgi:hypothetical protein